ncbi:DUF2627 domain-containing protein [Escherichia coli]
MCGIFSKEVLSKHVG